MKGFIAVPVIILFIVVSGIVGLYIIKSNQIQTQIHLNNQEQIATSSSKIETPSPSVTPSLKLSTPPISKPTDFATPTPSPSPKVDLNSQSSIKLNSVSPNPAVNNQQIILNGQSFGSGQGHVLFYNSNGTNMGGPAISSWNDTTIVTTVAFVKGGQFYLEVETASGQKSNKIPFTVSAGQPYIADVSPTIFKKGSTVTITGTEFGSSKGMLYFYKGYGNVMGYGIIGSWSDTQVIFTVPPTLGADEYGFQVVTSDNRISSYKYFNVVD